MKKWRVYAHFTSSDRQREWNRWYTASGENKVAALSDFAIRFPWCKVLKVVQKVPPKTGRFLYPEDRSF